MSDLFSVAGKTAVVTGGSRGIGLMIARGLVGAGARVIVSSRKADVCDRVAAELSEHGECSSMPADLSTEAECRRLADEVTDRLDGRLDILVNNAGATWGAPLDEFDDAAWDRVLDLNVKGVFHLSKHLHPALAASAGADDPAAGAQQVMERFTSLEPHPDVVPGLLALAGCGCRIVTLSNGSAGVARALLLKSEVMCSAMPRV